MTDALRTHWAEYLIEAAGLGVFMLSACLVTVVLQHPASPAHRLVADPTLRRAVIGIAMGLTAIALVYSPFGRRSGAHLNPVVTLTYLRLGMIAPWDACFYVTAQFAGGVAGVMVAKAIAGPGLAHPLVSYAVTVPGAFGVGAAFLAELAISFGMMTLVLQASNSPRLTRFTGLLCGALVALYIVVEAPLSGMSMNPARTVGSAVSAGTWTGLWVYFAAPLVGMLLAAEVRVRRTGLRSVYCAKLRHPDGGPCIFRCRYRELRDRPASSAPSWASARSAVARRHRLLVVALVAFLAAGASRSVAAVVDEVVSIGFTVGDMDRSVAFFTDVLRFSRDAEVVTGDTRVVRLRLGDERLDLTQHLGSSARPVPADSRSNDRWFQHAALVVRDMERAYAHLRAHDVVHASPWPQRLPDWNPNAGGIEAFYFKDPDGHVLEVIAFPPGKGDPRWQRPGDGLFLGIDHTAIVVADTDASLRFYRDALGLRVVGTSENHGPEQERLNAVPGAHLRITTLRAPRGPGIEFLEYLSPRTGRPYPRDTRPTDLVHWQTRLAVTRDALDDGRPPATTRDPDGHTLELIEEP